MPSLPKKLEKIHFGTIPRGKDLAVDLLPSRLRRHPGRIVTARALWRTRALVGKLAGGETE